MNTLLFGLLLPILSSASGIPDLPPDAGSSEYRSILQGKGTLLNLDGLNVVISAGERNLDWLDHINSRRPDNQKLSFTSKETQRSFPIDSPNEYNPSLILAEFAKVKSSYPAELAEVIFGGAAFTDEPPIDVKDYLEISRLLDNAYQSAGRWRVMEGWLPSLTSRRKNDIRGYYFLSRLKDRKEKLKNFADLSSEERSRIREWLIGMCFNGSGTLSQCQRELNNLIGAKGNLNTFYEKALARSESRYRSFFSIPSYATRRDFQWESLADGRQRLVAPFLDPTRPEVRYFVQHNVQDEWKWTDWRLELPFKSSGDHPFIVFEPGATPNVNGLGGNRITMNANQPLTEYDAQWTIRHEFGHVLGLPDCYVEFYVEEKQVIVNYQIDVENIMCSRRGHVKAENFEELKRAYSR